MSAETRPVYYDGGKYLRGRELVMEAIREIRNSQMSVPVQDAVIMLMGKVVGGTVEAANAIYTPLTQDADMRGHVGRETDLATDRRSFEEFPDFIKRLSTSQ